MINTQNISLNVPIVQSKGNIVAIWMEKKLY